MKAKFIVVEGLEGAGKTSVIDQIKSYLHNSGLDEVITTREPGGTLIAEQLRAIVKDKSSDEKISDITELLLMYASRVQLVDNIIKPALLSGTWVIGDRHELSTRAYQGGGRGISANKLELICNICLNGFTPDLTIYLDIDPKIGFARIEDRKHKDRIEMESLDFFDRVRSSYLQSIDEEQNIYLVDASQDIEMVHQDIFQLLNKTVLNS